MTRPLDTSIDQTLRFSTDPELRRRFMIVNESIPANVRWGRILERLDKLAEDVALRYVHGTAPDARVDRINFLQPVRIGDKLHFTSRVVYTGDTSMCVEITIERQSMDRITKALSTTCVFTFVKVDDELRPRPVSKVYPTTYAEDARYIEAHRRRLRHKGARKPGPAGGQRRVRSTLAVG